MKRTSLLLLASLPALLALPAPARAAVCAIASGDFDGNGVQDVRATGNAARQTLLVSVDGSGTTVSIDCNGDGDFVDTTAGDAVQTFPFPVETYDIQMGGQDTIRFDVAGSWSGLRKSVQVLLGAGGNNTVNFTAAAGAALQSSSRLLVDVAGYTLIDTLNITFPAVDNSSVLFRTELSAGNDVANFTLGGDLTNGAVVDVDAVLGAGTNTFSFTQPAAVTISASTLSVKAQGDVSIDTVRSVLNGTLSNNARAFLIADLGNGNDKYTGTLDLTTFKILSGAEVHIDANGGPGSDVFTLTRNGTAGGASTVNAGLLDVHLNTGTNDDKVDVDLAGGGFQMNGGTLALRVNGAAGNDTMTFALGANAGSTNPIFDVSITGERQNDPITFALDNPSANNTAANYGPAGTVLLDGSFGTDKCTVTGNGIVKKRGCES